MDAVLTLERLLVHWVAKDIRQRVLRRAALAAHREFVRRYPEWNAALFDEHFVVTWALPLLIDASAENLRVSAGVLASAWAHQISGTLECYHRRQVEAVPVAARYLQLVAAALETEHHAPAWRGYPDIHPAG